MGLRQTWGSVRRVIRQPALRRVLGSYLAFHVAEFATWVAVLLYAYERTGPASVGFVVLIQLLPAALVAAPAASLGDRLPRERVLTAGYLVQGIAMLLTAAAMVVVAPIPIVYGLAVLAAMSLVITRPTQSALLPSLSPTPADLAAANGAAGVVEGIGVLLGPLLAAVVLAGSSVAVVYLVAGAACVLAALTTVGLRPLAGREPPPADAARVAAMPEDASIRAGIRVLAHDGDARLVVGLLTARMVVIGMADVLFVLLALEVLHTGESGSAILNAALGLGTMAGGIVSIAVVGRGGLAAFAATGAIAWGGTLLLLGVSSSAAIAPWLVVAGGAGLTVVDVAGRTILQRAVDDRVLARVFGVQEGLAMAALAVGSVIVSAVAAVAGSFAALLLAAALLPVVVAMAGRRLVDLDRRVAPAAVVVESPLWSESSRSAAG